MANEAYIRFLEKLVLMDDQDLLDTVKALNIQSPKKLKEHLAAEIRMCQSMANTKSISVAEFKKRFEEEKRYPQMRRSMDFVPRTGATPPEAYGLILQVRVENLKGQLAKVEEVFGV